MSRKKSYEEMPADNWVDNLRIAIVHRAVEDYRDALKESEDAPMESARRPHQLKRLEAFFLGDCA